MNRPKHPIIVILVTLAAAVLVAVRHYLGLSCPIYAHLDLPCLTCGMTRATISALRLDFRSAFGYHPLFWTLPILYWTLATELSPFKSRRANKITLTVLTSAFVAVWIVRLITLLA